MDILWLILPYLTFSNCILACLAANVETCSESLGLEPPANFSLLEVISGSSALFSWNPVQPLCGNIKGYKIQVWTDGEEDKVRETLVKPDATRVIVSQFEPFKKNYARILSYNEVFNGSPSETLSFVAPEGCPDAVRSFQVYSMGASAFLLTWEKPMEENGILTGYKIYYQKIKDRKLGPLKERQKEIDPLFDRAKLSGLEPNTKYRIEIRATTKECEGEKYFTEQTTNDLSPVKPDVPAFETRTLSGENRTSQVLVRWLPVVNGHPGTHFVVWYKLKSQAEWRRTSQEVDDDFVILTGLELGQKYEVKMIAYDGEYSSDSESYAVSTNDENVPLEAADWSDVTDVPLEAPSKFVLQQVISGSTALLTWSPVQRESVRGHFKGYKIQIWTEGEEHRRKEIMVKPDVTKALVAKFRLNAMNHARILAYNELFNGPASETISFAPEYPPPGTYHLFVVYPIGPSAVFLEWEEPQDHRDSLTGYKIRYQEIEENMELGPVWSFKRDMYPKFYHAKLSGLGPNTKYLIEIQEETKGKDGDTFYAIAQTGEKVVSAKPDVPMFETETFQDKRGKALILVRWLPAINSHPGTHFVVWYKTRNHSEWVQTCMETDDDYILLRNLEPRQEYEVKVSAFDGHYSSSSESRVVMTLGDKNISEYYGIEVEGAESSECNIPRLRIQ